MRLFLRRPRFSSRWSVSLIVTAVVVAVAAGVWWTVVPPRPVDGYALAAPRLTVPHLPWPGEGQASVEVEGLGPLGTSGTQEPVPIASVTKVMTAYVVLKDHPLAEEEPGPEITVDQRAETESYSREEASAPVRAGQRLSLRRLLELMLVPSGGNVARLLARWDAGSEEAFVVKMNRAAAALGMTRTTYTGASGVEDSTTSTSADQLALARAAMRESAIRSVVAMRSVRGEGGSGTLTTTNTLLGRNGVIGLKTGATTAAGGALMWAAEADGGAGKRLVLGVVLHQNPGGTPEAGLATALAVSERLITAIGERLPGIAPAR
ncbi:D-alanyl-D-alanine carboxypeptidase family protein [Amycolatopsis samaneae]|uniref:D-alanyl-D-alanine carboxypeptidase family protein n=1 Tax=Amycolatopsis samaneae TaxID=664691 RepID=A0ABW5GFD6_9PSEU